MKSKATRRFWKAYAELPVAVQQSARNAYQFWLENHHHPSLHFKKLRGGENRFSVRVGNHYRAIGHLIGDTVEWVWIGTHEDYNKLVGRR
jgi:hypothetical protein